MNCIKIKILLALLLSFGGGSIYSQNKKNIKPKAVFSSVLTYKETLEERIAPLGEPYISWLSQTTDSISPNFANQITHLPWPLEESSNNHQHSISKEQHYKLAFQSLRQLKSRSIDPVWEVIANNPVNSICGKGDFEADSLNPPAIEWSGAWGNLTSPTNDPSFGTYTAGYLPASGIDAPVSSSANCSNGLVSDLPLQNHHSIVSAANDPLVGGLLRTTANPSSNYAFRIGNACNGFGSDMLSKKFVVSGNGIIKFSYALVMNGVHDSLTNPSFWVKIYDSVGNLLPGKVYLDPYGPPTDHIISSPTDPFFQHFDDTINFSGVINFKDWVCAKIDLSQNIGQTVSVALITTDCPFGGHWGYGYIDNWCGNCEGSTTGTVDVTIPDSCIAEGPQINVDYTLPIIGNDTGIVSITLTFYHNGSATGYTLVSPVLNANGTYSFTADADSLPCNGSGYDVVAQANFTVGPALNPTFYSITSPDPFSTSGIKPGLNNDLVCCPTLAEICDSTDANLIAIPGGCCYQLLISNKFSNSYFTGISITSDNLSISNISANNSWSTISYQTPNHVVFSKIGSSSGIPMDSAAFQILGNICFSGNVPANITIRFIGPAPLFDTICPKTIMIPGCVQPLDTSCVGMDSLTAECIAGVVKMKFKIKNNSAFIMRGLRLYSQNPNVVFSPVFVSIPDLLPGQTSSSFIQTTLLVSNNASSVCFFISACDQNTPPGQDGNYPNFCCMDSILYCVQIPACSPCDGINITAVKQNSVNCCYDLTLATNYSNANIGTLEFSGLNGTQFAVFTGSGWSIIPPVSSSHIKIKAFGNGVPPGTYSNFASFCLTGSSSPPHKVAINIMDINGVLLCRDTLSFDSCQLVQPSCANLVNDSLYCSGDKVKYTFYIKNNAPFPLYQVDFRTDTSVILDSQYMQIIPPVASGSTGGPYTVTIDSADANLSQFCMYLTAHNGIYDSINGLAATECCTDSMGGICLPMIICGDTVNCDTTLIVTDTTICCCQFGSITVANGITPNADGKNDLFEIKRPSCCEYISIEIYNRWGNMVFKESNYQNNWDGVNQSGQKLVQGTYFVVIELPDGNKKTTYLDIRY